MLLFHVKNNDIISYLAFQHIYSTKINIIKVSGVALAAHLALQFPVNLNYPRILFKHCQLFIGYRIIVFIVFSLRKGLRKVWGWKVKVKLKYWNNLPYFSVYRREMRTVCFHPSSFFVDQSHRPFWRVYRNRVPYFDKMKMMACSRILMNEIVLHYYGHLVL